MNKFTRQDALICISQGWVIPRFADMLLENLIDTGHVRQVLKYELTEKGEKELNNNKKD